MADAITTYVREILDNVQVIEATRAAATEEKVLAGVRAASGAAGVKAYKELQKAQADSAKAAERRTNKIEDELTGTITKTEALTRAILGQTDAIKSGGGATESAGRGAEALSAGSNKAAESAEKLAGVMGLVSPEAATLTRELGNVAKGMSVAGSAQTALSGVLGAGSALLGPLAAVATAAAFAYSQYAENAEKAAEAEKKWRQEQKDSADLGEKLTGQITALQREQAVLAGTMTQVEVDTKTAAEAIDKDYAESIVKAINKVDDFKAQLAALDTKIKNGDGYAYELLDQQNALNESLEQAQIEYDGLNARLNTLQETSAKVVAGKAAEKQATKDAQEAEKKAAEAKRRAAEATRKADKEAADAARELEKARTDELAIAASLTKAEEDRTKAISKGVKALRDQEDAAKKSSRTAEEAIDAATDAALAQADASARAAFAEAETADERLQIEKALADARVAINIDAFNQIIQAQADADQKRLELEEKAYEDAEKVAKDAAKTELELQKKTASEISEAYGIASDALGDYFDSVLGEREDKIKELEDAIEEATDNGEKGRAASLERQLAAEKAAAEKAFKWQQALSASNATVNWLEAVVKATTYGPIGGPLVAGAATLAYGLSLKQIESEEPSFNDTPAGGYRFDGGSQSIRGAVNDTGILFRDPLEGVQQALDVMARRQAPTSTAGPAPRDLLGLNLARTPVGRLLTRDAERLTRGRLPGGRIGG